MLQIKGGINMSGRRVSTRLGGGVYQHALGGYMLGGATCLGGLHAWGGGGATCLGGGGTCLAGGLLLQYNVPVQSYTLKTTLSK